MREGRLRTLHDPMLAFLESLEFLEILRLLKLENFITMVRRNLGSATPPSVMALLGLEQTWFFSLRRNMKRTKSKMLRSVRKADKEKQKITLLHWRQKSHFSCPAFEGFL